MSKWNLVRLSEVLNYEQPTKYIVETTNYNGKYNTPVLTAGKTFLLGYTNEKTGIFPKEKLPIIIFDDFTTASKLVDFQFKVKSSAMKMLHPKNKDVDIKYVFYAIKNIPFSPEEHKRFWISKYSKFRIPFPPLPEQQKITSFLTRIEALIQKREESIQLLDELIKSTFLDMFQDILIIENSSLQKEFQEIAIIDTNMVDNFIQYADYPHIGIGNIEKETGKLINYKLVRDEGLVSGKYLFDERHILYSKIRPNLNKVAMPNFKGLLSADGYPILPIESLVTREFLTYLLRSKYFLHYILDHSDRANIPKVNKKELYGFSCNIPPKPLQEKFTSIVTKIEATKEKYQTSLEELNNLFNSTAQKAFKGELNLGKIAVTEKEISKEEAQMLDEDTILALIQAGSFEAKDHVNEQQSYDDIRDKVLKLMDEGKITQKFAADKKMVLEAVNAR